MFFIQNALVFLVVLLVNTSAIGHHLFHIPTLDQNIENCENGIDDDNDGLIDCFDPDCSCIAPCIDNYYSGCEVDCEYTPNCEVIEVETFWISETNTGSYPLLIAGDIDADQIPEVVAYTTTLDTISILDGQTGERELMIIPPVRLDGGMAPALGDIDLEKLY